MTTPSPQHDVLDRAVEALQQTPAASPPDAAFHEQLMEQAAQIDAAASEPEQARLVLADDSLQPSNPRRFWMKPIFRFGVAATLGLAIVLGMALWPKTINPNAAFADMIEQVRQIEAVRFTTHIPGPEGQVMVVRSLAVNPGLMRQEFEGMGIVNIIDFQAEQIITLMPEQQQAHVIDIAGLPESAKPQDIVAEFSVLDPEHATFLRDDVHEGAAIRVYEYSQTPFVGEVWVDVETSLPVRLDVRSPGSGNTEEVFVEMSDFEWNPQVDPAMLSREIPEGYEVRTMDLGQPSEAEWVLVLRMWSALSGEPFPDVFGPGHVASMGQMMQPPDGTGEEKLAWLRDRFGPIFGADGFTEDQIEAKMMHVGETMARGAMFLATFNEGDWAWVGGGVEAGDAEAVLCYWREADQEDYRVVFGDFRVESMSAEDIQARFPTE